MVGQPSSRDEAQWIIEPPETGEIRFHVAVGEGTEITSELRAAIDNLMRAVQRQGETQGYAAGLPPMAACLPDLSCGTYVGSCTPLNGCTKLIQQPCVAEVSCIIKPRK